MSNLKFKIIEGTRSAALSIFAHGFRSFLTTLGIIIGVASVIAVAVSYTHLTLPTSDLV